MPAPAMTPAQRDKLRIALSKAIIASGRSVRRAAIEIARQRGANEATMVKNFQRWLAPVPREGAIDAAPDWTVEAVAALKPITAYTLSDELRAAIADKHVPLTLAQRAADALRASGK